MQAITFYYNDELTKEKKKRIVRILIVYRIVALHTSQLKEMGPRLQTLVYCCVI